MEEIRVVLKLFEHLPGVVLEEGNMQAGKATTCQIQVL
jgi:hypothetical protein